ncbi:unnamed protein product [Malassezia sympodialis ATCC 42132]|uniref:Uncharacterized protein n=1 Tax=Malassezia sympodialis (strain ATCC 42132) TaxID=1230383 RepID=M5EKQ6_MALS4|nr:uncharacterized protein MSY001_0916 [Malassezia sympodialis ATCC 42132]CCU98210.1 unnamed protein product [Malassezia sympodialis ATCC 42132]SHO76012.1 Uncharacterized protein MSYG_0346 [Malassezia sympodialis ATCC 42132]|eukprot:XP_018739529.1 uncharacterized protein MSY001_0916 [Malassezia sympodialis ATCC 42132]
MDPIAQASLDRVLAAVEAERALSEDLREHAKVLDRAQRKVCVQLGQVHALPLSQVPAHLEVVAASMRDVREALAQLAAQVPAHEFYRWCDTWAGSVRSATYAAALAFYLGTGGLLSKEGAERVLGLDTLPPHQMQLTTDDYLHGLISMVNDLPRLAVTAVIAGDYHTPLSVVTLVKQVHAAFQVLNLKNDALRKRFDSLKYDVKRAEDVLYDIHLRGLHKQAASDDAERLVQCDGASDAMLARLCGM